MTTDTTTEATPALTLEVIASQITKFEPDKVDAICAAVQTHAKTLVVDATTAKGREAAKSEAFKVAKTKTQLLAVIDSSIEDAKKIVKVGTTAKSQITAAFDSARDAIKAPALEWEAKDEAKKAAIKERVDLIREQGKNLDGLTVDELAARVAEIDRLFLDFDFGQFKEAALTADGEAKGKLAIAMDARRQFDADQAELRRLREEAANRAEEEAARVASEKAAQAKRDAEESAKRAAEAEAARVAQAKRDEEAAKRARNLKAIDTLKEWAAPGCEDAAKLNARLESIKEFVVSVERFGDLYDAVVAVYDLARVNVEAQIRALAAKAAQEAKERAAREAKEKAEADAKRAADEAKRIEEAKIKAAEDERKRIEAEQAAKAWEWERNRQIAEAAEMARKANEEHRATVRRQAIEDVSDYCHTPQDAIEFVAATERGEIRHISITF